MGGHSAGSSPTGHPPCYISRGGGELRRSGDLSLDGRNDTGIGQGAEVAQLIAFSTRDLAHDTAHDLTRPRLGEVGNDENFLRGSKRPNDLSNLKGELLGEGGLIVGIVREFATEEVSVNPRTWEFIWRKDTYGLRVTKAWTA